MSTLEDRYRRLLALYPAEHRRAFGDEMLGVLLSNADEGQQLMHLVELGRQAERTAGENR